MEVLKGSGNDPNDPSWNSGAKVKVSLAPSPIDSQPNHYIREAWANKEYGTTKEADVTLGSEGKKFYIRLEWSSNVEKHAEFPEAAAVFFPASESPSSPMTIGTRENPVRMWQWKNRLPVQSKLPKVLDLIATGPGVFHPAKTINGSNQSQSLQGNGTFEDGKWKVVISGDLDVVVGSKKMGIAIWNGANQERAGLGAVSTEWIDIDLAGIGL
ncbi:MAG: hypothetical protein HKL80_10320 [Acidimicrobiales bacterium]|nr:hypothetical protein [Acidimicrobiales bacterium]